MQAIALAGLKHSGARGLVRLAAPPGPALAELAHSLVDERINLPLLACLGGGEAARACLAVEAEVATRALVLATRTARAHGLAEPSLAEPVAALTLFPLARSLRLPAAALAVLEQAGIRPLALGTSLSALVLVVERKLAQPALEALTAAFRLPKERSPAGDGVKVVQAPPGEEVCLSGETVAVYAERPVRCYGLMLLAAALVRARLEPGALAAAAAELAAAEPALKLACLSAAWEDGAAALSACLPPEPAQRLAGVLAAHGGEVEGPREASLIHLQGPHFGDRYGIAAAALDGLAAAGAAPLALSGMVHSLFVAVEPARAAAALEGLGGQFRAPE